MKGCLGWLSRLGGRLTATLGLGCERSRMMEMAGGYLYAWQSASFRGDEGPFK
jgi:hypothetical protein